MYVSFSLLKKLHIISNYLKRVYKNKSHITLKRSQKFQEKKQGKLK